MNMMHRLWYDLVGRLVGPMQFRLYLQPLMASILAIRDGIKDARAGDDAYFHSLLTDPLHRPAKLKAGIAAVARVLIFAVLMDAVYQIIQLHWFYLGEAILVALQLAFIPYLIIRGPANRIAVWWLRRHSAGNPVKEIKHE